MVYLGDGSGSGKTLPAALGNYTLPANSTAWRVLLNESNPAWKAQTDTLPVGSYLAQFHVLSGQHEYRSVASDTVYFNIAPRAPATLAAIDALRLRAVPIAAALPGGALLSFVQPLCFNSLTIATPPRNCRKRRAITSSQFRGGSL